MFRLDNLLEQWATIYRPLSHTPGAKSDHRTFFRIGMIDQNSEFIRNFATTPSPAMAYATHIDAELAAQNPKAVSYRHVIYFMAKQQSGTLSKTQATDELSATEARFQTDDMVQDLLAYLFALKAVVGGKRIIKSVAMDMVKLEKYQGMSASISTVITLFVSSITGMPVSTSHCSTSAIMGVGASKSIKRVNWDIAKNMVTAWVLTFPCCGLIGFLLAKVFMLF